ncbi:hypothetical protein BC833DRAFT_618939 [Globomyces pollinis-pini]|nr:hypothetical protein BC833DRAFT_618939 [Globomyces pollinis-pini]
MDDSSLKSLAIVSKVVGVTPIVLSPPFNKKLKLYSTVVESKVDAITVKAIPTESDAFCQVQKTGKDGSVSLKIGPNEVEVKVDAPDGSHSIYVIQVYRTSDTDFALSDIKLSKDQMLIPKFSKLETEYLITVPSEVLDISIDVIPLNPKATVALIQPESTTKEVKLNTGDTVLEYRVLAENKLNEGQLLITARKEKSLYRPNPMKLINSLACSFCKNLLFAPRKSLFGCEHSFCFSCLSVAHEIKSNAGVENSISWLCPICINQPATINPLKQSDVEKEKILNEIETQCPFARFGCKETKKFIEMNAHIQICSFSISTCVECNKFSIMGQLTENKHNDACTYNCTDCAKKVPTTIKQYHSNFCNLKKETLSITNLSSPSKWESSMVDLKLYGNLSLDKAVSEISSLTENYMQQYSSGWEQVIESDGLSKVCIKLDTLQTASQIMATMISINTSSNLSRNAALDCQLHIKLGDIAQLITDSKFWFPPIEQKNSKSNDNDQAADSFMADEVTGLLLQLGIPPSATYATQIKAMEAEYHRFKNQGSVNEAAEVQNLITWKMKQEKSNGVEGNDTDSTQSGNADLFNVTKKYFDAVTIDPNNLEANLKYTKQLLISNDSKRANIFARNAQNIQPCNLDAQLFVGISLLHPRATEQLDVVLLEESMTYLEQYYNQIMGVFNSNTPINTKLSILRYQKNLLIVDPILILLFLSLAKGYRQQFKFQNAINCLLDLIQILTATFQKYPRKSEGFYFVCQNICVAQSCILDISTIDSGICKELHINIKNTLLSMMKKFMMNCQGTKDEKVLEIELGIVKNMLKCDPTSSKFLSALGYNYLEHFDLIQLNNQSEPLLNLAESSFMASIESENISEGGVPSIKLTSQKWWDDFQKSLTAEKNILKNNMAKSEKAGGKKDALPSKANKSAPPPKAESNIKDNTKKAMTVTKPVAAIKKPATNAKPIAKEVPPTPKTANGPSKVVASTPNKPQKTTKTTAIESKDKKPPTINETSATQDSTIPVDIPQPITTIEGKKLVAPRLGLANTLSRLLNLHKQGSTVQSDEKVLITRMINLYQEVISIDKSCHDAYIELGVLYEQQSLITEAINLFTSYPFNEVTSQDDLYLHGEILRLLMKGKHYKHPHLARSLIAEGRAMGIKTMSKYIEALDSANENQLLMKVYAEVNRKKIDDPDLVAFFKSKYWL